MITESQQYHNDKKLQQDHKDNRTTTVSQ